MRAIMVRGVWSIETTPRVPLLRAQHVLPYYELLIASAWAIPKAANKTGQTGLCCIMLLTLGAHAQRGLR